jgi:CRISPR-associated endonuclease/helicase Cas3
MAIGPDQLTLFWAKRDRETGACHPVLCHLLDVANVARLLWQEVFHDAIRRRLSAELRLDPPSAQAWISFWAGCHDLGKVSPAFQSRSTDRSSFSFAYRST